MTNATKLALEESLKHLLLKKPLDKITINDLTTDCGISRMAFYYHFKDIYDLVEWSCQEDASRALAGKKTYETWQQGLLQIFEAVQENKPFILNVYRSVSREQVENYLYQVTYRLLEDVVEEQARGMSVRPEDKAFIATLYKYMFVGLMLDWVKSDMKGDPHTMVERLEQVVMLYESDGTADSLAVFLQKTWREKLGIQVTLRGVSASEITKALEQGEYTLAALRVTSDRNDATGFLNRWRTGNEGNYANFDSSAYDMLLGVASVSASKEARDAYLEDAERLLLEKGNVIPLYHSTRSWSLSEKYTGLFGDGLGRYFFTGIHAAGK